MDKPDCYKCYYKHNIPGDCHSSCTNTNANVTENPHGKKMGWFMWPYNYDPVWLISCDGFIRKIVS